MSRRLPKRVSPLILGLATGGVVGAGTIAGDITLGKSQLPETEDTGVESSGWLMPSIRIGGGRGNPGNAPAEPDIPSNFVSAEALVTTCAHVLIAI